MVCFLTSRADDPATGMLNPANGFADELRRRFPSPCRALHVCSDPDAWETTDFYASLTRKCFEDAGFVFERFVNLDARNEGDAARLVRGSNFMILAGGHVPTQNRFFEKIGLRALMRGFDGVVVGVSAGSMNSADVVYAQPEENGEATDPAYRRFITGLGLTETMILPHWHDVRNDVLDGLRVVEDVTLPDSVGRTFYAIPDGSYLLVGPGGEELCGEAYMIRDGRVSKIAADGERVTILSKNA